MSKWKETMKQHRVSLVEMESRSILASYSISRAAQGFTVVHVSLILKSLNEFNDVCRLARD